MKIADTNSEPPFRVRVNRTGRRTFSREYKLEIVQECSVPGASVAAVALSHRINANQVRKWIVQHRAGRLCPVSTGTPAMLPVTLAATSQRSPAAPFESMLSRARHRAGGVIEVELECVRLRVRGAVDGDALRAVLEVLAKR